MIFLYSVVAFLIAVILVGPIIAAWDFWFERSNGATWGFIAYAASVFAWIGLLAQIMYWMGVFR